jgi:hypothetical protein
MRLSRSSLRLKQQSAMHDGVTGSFGVESYPELVYLALSAEARVGPYYTYIC